MNIGFYPGCSLEGTAKEYNQSVRALAEEFDIDLKEIPDWNCCGATAAHNLNKDLSLSLPARVMALAEKEGFEEILVPCAACYNRLSVSKHELTENQTKGKQISDIIEMAFSGKGKIINILQFLEDKIMDKIGEKIKTPFNHKVACYYGCLLVRPHKILKFDRPEDPNSMDNIMKKLGAEPLNWSFKVECCGAGFSVSKTDIVSELSGKIIEDATQRGAEAIIVACPMCHSNLDMRRSDIETYADKKYSIPVLYITQAIGMALGFEEKNLGLDRHLVPVKFPQQIIPQKTVPENTQPEITG